MDSSSIEWGADHFLHRHNQPQLHDIDYFCTVTGLTNGTAYTTVTATNAAHQRSLCAE